MFTSRGSIRYVRVRGKDGGGVMFMCPYMFDAALCGVPVKNVACSLPLVGYPCGIV